MDVLARLEKTANASIPIRKAVGNYINNMTGRKIRKLEEEAKRTSMNSRRWVQLGKEIHNAKVDRNWSYLGTGVAGAGAASGFAGYKAFKDKDHGQAVEDLGDENKKTQSSIKKSAEELIQELEKTAAPIEQQVPEGHIRGSADGASIGAGYGILGGALTAGLRNTTKVLEDRDRGYALELPWIDERPGGVKGYMREKGALRGLGGLAGRAAVGGLIGATIGSGVGGGVGSLKDAVTIAKQEKLEQRQALKEAIKEELRQEMYQQASENELFERLEKTAGFGRKLWQATGIPTRKAQKAYDNFASADNFFGRTPREYFDEANVYKALVDREGGLRDRARSDIALPALLTGLAGTSIGLGTHQMNQLHEEAMQELEAENGRAFPQEEEQLAEENLMERLEKTANPMAALSEEEEQADPRLLELQQILQEKQQALDGSSNQLDPSLLQKQQTSLGVGAGVGSFGGAMLGTLYGSSIPGKIGLGALGALGGGLAGVVAASPVARHYMKKQDPELMDQHLNAIHEYANAQKTLNDYNANTRQGAASVSNAPAGEDKTASEQLLERLEKTANDQDPNQTRQDRRFLTETFLGGGIPAYYAKRDNKWGVNPEDSHAMANAKILALQGGITGAGMGALSAKLTGQNPLAAGALQGAQGAAGFALSGALLGRLHDRWDRKHPAESVISEDQAVSEQDELMERLEKSAARASFGAGVKNFFKNVTGKNYKEKKNVFNTWNTPKAMEANAPKMGGVEKYRNHLDQLESSTNQAKSDMDKARKKLKIGAGIGVGGVAGVGTYKTTKEKLDKATANNGATEEKEVLKTASEVEKHEEKLAFSAVASNETITPPEVEHDEKTASPEEEQLNGLFKEAAAAILNEVLPEVKQHVDPMSRIRF